jgi:hypothetical protein
MTKQQELLEPRRLQSFIAYIEPELAPKIRRAAKADGRSISSYLRQLAVEALREQEQTSAR